MNKFIHPHMYGISKVVPRESLVWRSILVTPVGKLPQSIQAWYIIGASNSILRGITQGFPIKIISTIIQNQLYCPIFTSEQIIWIDEKIEDYLKRSNLVIATKKPRLISNFFLVPKPIKLWRLVADFRPLNLFSRRIKKIKLETLEMFLPYIKRYAFLLMWDLKDFYLHFPIRPEDQDLMSIKWKKHIYNFTTLTFGWKESAYISSKAIRYVIAYLRSLGITMTQYCDEGIASIDAENNPNSPIIEETTLSIQKTLKWLGLEVQEAKTDWIPKQSVLYLGLIIDTIKMKVFVPNHKMNNLYSLMSIILKVSTISRKFLAKVAGKLNSISLAFLPAKFLARPFHNCIGRKKELETNYHFWSQRITISEEVIQSANFFMKEAKLWNGRTFFPEEILTLIELDSSWSSLGAVLNGEEIIQRAWNESELPNHINWKELMTAFIAISEWKEKLSGKKIIIKTDNQVAFYYLKKAGGKIPTLNLIVKQLYQILLEYRIQLYQITWIPSEENVFADLLSRGRDVLEWELDQNIFNMITEKFGHLDIDRFASDFNFKIKRFNAINHQYGKLAENLDAFSQSWKRERNFINAPFNLIPRILRKIKEEKAFAVMIIPNWKSQIWFNLAMELTKEMMEINLSPETCFSAKIGMTPEPLKNPKWRFLAIKIEF